MNSFSEIAFSLSHEFSCEKNISGSTITGNIILSCSSTANHSSSGVLNLHLVEENSTVFGELNLTSTTNQPKKIERAIRI